VLTTLEQTLAHLLLETTDPASAVDAAVDAVLVVAVAAEIRPLHALAERIHATDIAAACVVVD
jgi:hypothetical protein